MRRKPNDLAAKAFPVRLQRARSRRGLSRRELASQFGVTRQAVDSWERGISLPSFVQLIAVCDLFEWPNPLG